MGILDEIRGRRVYLDTNDQRLEAVPGLEILLCSDIVAP